jgi:hypothetical protein
VSRIFVLARAMVLPFLSTVPCAYRIAGARSWNSGAPGLSTLCHRTRCGGFRLTGLTEP